MQNIRCPKCAYHYDNYHCPLGKIVRNPYAAKGSVPVHDNCNACEGTGYIPGKVIDSIIRFSRDSGRAQEYISGLRWSGDHYSFMVGSMYVGVEVDGYLHT